MQTTMRTEKLNKIVEGLCKVSEKHYINPFDQLKWPETVDRNNWFTSPELISIEGTPLWDSLEDSQQYSWHWFLYRFYGMSSRAQTSSALTSYQILLHSLIPSVLADSQD